MRLLARRLLALCAALVLAFAVAEVAVRATGVVGPLPSQYVRFVADPVLPYRLQPGSEIRGRSGSDEFDFHYVHGSHGFRDRERASEKPDGTFRILGLGDSFTYGAGVAAEETYLARLERALHGRAGDGRAVEVVRAGVPRYFTRPERLLFEQDGEGWDPDLVLLGFVPNDVVDTAVGSDGVRVTEDGRLISTDLAALIERLGGASRWLYERSHLARLGLRAWLARADARAAPAPRLDDVYAAGGPLEGAWEEVEEELSSLAALAAERDVPLVVVHLPQRPPWTPERDYPAERLSAWAEAAGVVFIDTLPALRAHPGTADLYWPIDGHPRAAAHAVFARVLGEELSARGLVP